MECEREADRAGRKKVEEGVAGGFSRSARKKRKQALLGEKGTFNK